MIILDANDFFQDELILNMCFSLSSILIKEIKIININLSQETINNIVILKKLTNAYVEGAILNSNSIIFSPTKKICSKQIDHPYENKSFLSIASCFLLHLIFSGNKIKFKLKSNLYSNNISLFYFKEVLLKYFQKYIYSYSLNLNSTTNNLELTIDSKNNFEKISELKLNYSSNLIAIKNYHLYSNKLNSIYFSKINDLFKISFPNKTITNLFQENNSNDIILDSIFIFGENHNFENNDFHMKYFSKTFSLDDFTSTIEFQKQILIYTSYLKQNLSTIGIDEISAIFLIPVIALMGGEIIIQEKTDKINSIIEITEKIFNIKFEINKNTISYNVISIDEL